MNLMNTLKTAAKASKTFVVKNSPTILTGLSATSTVSAVIFAVKATPKAVAVIEEKEKELGRKLKWTEKVKYCGKYYIAPAGMVLVSIGAAFGANTINLSRNAKLVAACGAMQTTLNEYQKQVIETVGKETEHDIRKRAAETQANAEVERGATKNLPMGDELFYLYDTDQWFRSDIFKVRNWGVEIREKMIKGPQFYVSAPMAFEMLDNPSVKCPPYLVDSGVTMDDEFRILEEPARTKEGEAYTILYFDPPMHESFTNDLH